ncbi:hypothetical protein TetV_179 [Tetraselmis virus 1]|uniref:Uncharacterized protein n=1 Tax=Tetraselmis virus 1 TaxID=2060617 RepID=A0A2P0VN02_9VIRU|nr:hypothetical protein QJ968_gp179 [Tetraselmis virus 1]AUF82271.1 hypothetical protein TetV_179 [Tetraselmis virus 1]
MMKRYAHELVTKGYCVVPLPDRTRSLLKIVTTRLKSNRPLKEKLSKGLAAFSPVVVDGVEHKGCHPGFGGCGFPSSIHGTDCRDLFDSIHEDVYIPFCKALITHKIIQDLVGDDPYMAFIIDRWCERYPDITPGSEDPHRDISPDTLSFFRDCLMFGGFINANTTKNENQYFTCSEGTHSFAAVRDQGKGFAKISKEEAKKYKFQSVEVPPNHILIFVENIVHKVRIKKYKYSILRLFTAFQLWKGASPCQDSAPCRAPDNQGKPCFLCMQTLFCKKGSFTHVKSKQDNPIFPAFYKNFPKLQKNLVAISHQVPALFDSNPQKMKRVHPPIELDKEYTDRELKKLRGCKLG